jgi:carboxyl-terminal processing protease
LTVIFATAVISLLCYHKVERNRYAATITEAMHLIGSNYIEAVDERVLFENAMRGMVNNLDEYSAYIPPDGYEQFQETLDQEFGGIGIVVEGPPRAERLTVLSPLVGTPAYRAGMRAGDVILVIDGQTTEGMSLEDAVMLMRGEKGTAVRVLVKHPGEDAPVEMSIKRDAIRIESVLGDRRREDGLWDFVLEEDVRIGYVRIITFGEHTVGELEEALAFEGREVAGLIIDLRGNAGGLLTAAVESCDLFLDEGVIVSTRGREGVVKREYAARPSVKFDRERPLAVLTNNFAASASEIVAACLQDHGRAVIVGERTWGKGTVQNIIDLEGGESALKLTTANYWRPSGRNIHRRKNASEEDDWGVRPNEGFEVILDQKQQEKLRLHRQNRDLYQRPEGVEEVPPDEAVQRSDTPPADLSPDQSEDSEPFDDPQLRKAIEYIQDQISRRAASSARA